MTNLRMAIPVLLLTLAALNLSAQNSRWGIGPIVGANFTTVSGDNTDDAGYKPGFAAGLLVNYSNIQHFGITGKLLFSQYGSKFEFPGFDDVNDTYNYLQLPIQAVYYFGGLEDNFRPKIFAGPYVGYLLSVDTDGEGELGSIDKDFFNDIDAGVLGGVGFNYLLGGRAWLNLDLHYTVGLANINDNDLDFTNHNQGFGAQVGVSFSLNDE